MKHKVGATSDMASADDAIGSGRICTVPNTNDWYLITDDDVTLGPYQSRQEAVAMLALLRRHHRAGSTRTEPEKP